MEEGEYFPTNPFFCFRTPGALSVSPVSSIDVGLGGEGRYIFPASSDFLMCQCGTWVRNEQEPTSELTEQLAESVPDLEQEGWGAPAGSSVPLQDGIHAW